MLIDPDLKSPESQAAVAFMEHKGYRATPLGLVVEEEAWYFYFEVPEGLIELEVEFEDEQWWCQVVTFWTYDEMEDGWTPADFIQQQRELADNGDA